MAEDIYYTNRSTGLNLRIGRIEGDVFFAMREEGTFFKMYQSFGLSVEVLAQLNLKKVKTIQFTYKGRHGVKTYRTTLQKYLDSDKIYIDKGDTQKHVSTRDMQEI